MLFNSPEFLFAFLPLTLLLFYAIGRISGSKTWPMVWLVCASLFFYAWWEWENLFLLGFSLVFNYTLSQWLIGRTTAGTPSKAGMWLGVVVNLGLLTWFKYGNFAAHNIGAALGESWSLGHIVLPLAISFFTFQQISYVVDGYRGQVARCSPLDYAMVVTFFPHPLAVVAPDRVPRQLLSIHDRVDLALSLGVAAVVVLPFTNELAAVSAVSTMCR